MLVRIGSSKDVLPGQMRVFDLKGTRINQPGGQCVPVR